MGFEKDDAMLDERRAERRLLPLRRVHVGDERRVERALAHSPEDVLLRV
jgi:hypothetical protein